MSHFRFLTSGDSYLSLKVRFRRGLGTIHEIIRDTCQAIWCVFKPIVMPEPDRERWQKIEKGFRLPWNFPNCLGALDGKHVNIIAPYNSGSTFHNYKYHFSTVLMVLVDANYCFIYVDIGEYGSNSDANVFQFSKFGMKYMEGRMDTPPNKQLPNYPNEGPMPHVIVADEAFPLKHNIMRPYPRGTQVSLPHEEAIFNYRLGRARMPVQNTFRILAQRWRIFDRKMPLDSTNVDFIVQACLCLHNMLTTDKELHEIAAQLNPNNIPYLEDDGLIRYLPRLNGYHAGQDAQGVRDIFRGYFNSPEGSTSWQHRRVSYRL